MIGLILGLILSQATAGVRISVSVLRPTCVVIDASGEAKVVQRRLVIVGERTLACTSSSEGGSPRVEQRVEVAATADAPEQRVVEVNF